MEQQQKKKQKIVEETQAAKERYVRYWKDKLTNIYTEQAQTIIETSKRKEENQKELQRLE
jgi:phage-related minor tail protein